MFKRLDRQEKQLSVFYLVLLALVFAQAWGMF